MSLWGKLGSFGAMLGGGILSAIPGGAAFGLPLIGAGLGGAKHEFEDLPKEERANTLAAETQRYAPWTGLVAEKPQTSSGIGDVISGGVTGASIGQGLTKAGLIGGQGLSGGPSPGMGGGPNLGVNTNLGYGANNIASMNADVNAAMPMASQSIPVIPANSASIGGGQGLSGFGMGLNQSTPAQGLGAYDDTQWSKLLRSKQPGAINLYG